MNIKSAIEAAVLDAIGCVGLGYSQPARLTASKRDCSSLVARSYIAAGYEWGCMGSRCLAASKKSTIRIRTDLAGERQLRRHRKKPPYQCCHAKEDRPAARGSAFRGDQGNSLYPKNKIEHVVMLTSASRIVHARGTATVCAKIT
jgi:hypothetical protein